jgi:hypothetical protein
MNKQPGTPLARLSTPALANAWLGVAARSLGAEAASSSAWSSLLDGSGDELLSLLSSAALKRFHSPG